MEVVKPHKGWSLLSADCIEHTNADSFQNFIFYKPRLDHLKMSEEKEVLMMRYRPRDQVCETFTPIQIPSLWYVSLFLPQEPTKLIIFLQKNPEQPNCKRNMQRKKTIYKKTKSEPIKQKWESCLVVIHMKANFDLADGSPESPRERPYRILLERRPHLSLVSAPNSWRSQRTEEQCTWSSFPAHHTSSTVCGEKGQCHHLTFCFFSCSSNRLCPSNTKQQLLQKRFPSFCIKELEIMLADSLSLSV